jgi:hypothetical protein
MLMLVGVGPDGDGGPLPPGDPGAPELAEAAARGAAGGIGSARRERGEKGELVSRARTLNQQVTEWGSCARTLTPKEKDGAWEEEEGGGEGETKLSGLRISAAREIKQLADDAHNIFWLEAWSWHCAQATPVLEPWRPGQGMHDDIPLNILSLGATPVLDPCDGATPVLHANTPPKFSLSGRTGRTLRVVNLPAATVPGQRRQQLCQDS